MNHGPLRPVRDGDIITVTIDSPPLNLVDGPLIGGLLSFLPTVEADESVKVVVFASADPDFFLMHGDVEQLMSVPPSDGEPAHEPNIAAATFDRIHHARFVSIGVIDGAARGGGCEFLSALDLRIGTPRAVVGQPEVAMGILPGAGGTVRWPRLIGRAAALEALLTGRDMGADELLGCRWLQAISPSDRVNRDARALAESIARMPGDSIAAIKRIVDLSLGGSTEALTAESDALASLMASGGHLGPMQKFLDAGGQTRDTETGDFAVLLDAMTDRDDPDRR